MLYFVQFSCSLERDVKAHTILLLVFSNALVSHLNKELTTIEHMCYVC